MKSSKYTYKETKDYQNTVVEVDGVVFIHIEVVKMTHKVLREVKLLFKELCGHFANEGHELVFTTVVNPKVLKLCYSFQPPYDVRRIEGEAQPFWVVAWETGLEV